MLFVTEEGLRNVSLLVCLKLIIDCFLLLSLFPVNYHLLANYDSSIESDRSNFCRLTQPVSTLLTPIPRN